MKQPFTNGEWTTLAWGAFLIFCIVSGVLRKPVVVNVIVPPTTQPTEEQHDPT